MGERETKFWDGVLRHRRKIYIAAVTLLSLYARFALRGIISGDMEFCLLPWYGNIQEMGGLRALTTQVGNYNIPYQTLIALMTYLPIHPVYAYKGLSILFDYALAVAAMTIVQEISHSRTKSALAYSLIVLAPFTLMNSAAWGQCDSIYTFFLAMTFLFLLREKHKGAFLWFGCAFAFKLQAVFFLPFLLFYHVWRRKTSLWQFLLIPVPLLIFSLVALVQGRDIASLLNIYVEQVQSETPHISMNYPSFWLLMVKNLVMDGSDYYTELHVLCLAVTIVLLGAQMMLLVSRKDLSPKALLTLAAFMMYTCVFFLPSMHDRYAYPAVAFTLMACLTDPGLIPVAVGHQVLEMEMYSSGLNFKEPIAWEVMTLINLACYAWMAFRVYHLTLRPENTITLTKGQFNHQIGSQEDAK